MLDKQFKQLLDNINDLFSIKHLETTSWRTVVLQLSCKLPTFKTQNLKNPKFSKYEITFIGFYGDAEIKPVLAFQR